MPSDPDRLRVAVLFGGRSNEHAISCLSAASVLAALPRERYDVISVGITPEGRWVLGPTDPAALAASGRELPSVDTSGTALALPPDPTIGGLTGLASAGGIDVVFPVLHGAYGEDGTVQGLLEMAGLPYVGSGVLASAVAMDKEFMKLLLTARGLPVGPWAVITNGQWTDRVGRGRADALDRVRALGLPVFVKPARGGSSLGISKVRDAADLETAIEAARLHDPKVVVEAMLTGREIECGVLVGAGGRGGAAEASVPAEVRVTGGQDFYDFEAKYLDDATQFDVPADLPASVTAAVQEAAVSAFQALGCAGLARVDFFVTADGAVVVNEVNTMPGFTAASLFPRMWAASGVDYPQLVERLVDAALAAGTGLR